MATATKTRRASKTGKVAVKPRPKSAGTTRKAATTKAAPAKGRATKASTKTAKTTKAAPVAQGTGRPRNFDPFGFVIDSDSSIIAHALVEGGSDRIGVNATIAERIEKVNGLSTRSGNQKNVPSLVSGILSRLEEQGYTVESNWVLKPPADVAKKVSAAKATEKRRATRARKSKS